MNNDHARAVPASACIRRAVAAVFATLSLVLVVPTAHAGYASLVMDASNGRVLSETNSDLPHFPASLTKMMSLYLLFEALEGGRVTLDQALPVSQHASQQPPTKLGLRPGQWITVESAILGLVTKSANDAAAVIAEGLGGSEPHFAAMMTAKARALGMSQSRFDNASGLPDPEQVTTAHDMALLALALLHDFPQYYHYFSIERFYYGNGVHPNHNSMLGQYPGLDGIKTGYTNAAGYNLVASAERGGRRVIGVVLGARSSANRSSIMAGLLDQAFAGGEVVPAEHTLPARVIPAAYAASARSTTAAAGALAPALAAEPGSRGTDVSAPAPRSAAAPARRREVRGGNVQAAKAQAAKAQGGKRATVASSTRPTSSRTASASSSAKAGKAAPAQARASATGPSGKAAPATKTKAAVAGSGMKTPTAKPAKVAHATTAPKKRGVAESDRRPPS